METFAEIKCMGDGYAGGFSCGMTMHGSQTMERFTLKSGAEDFGEGTAVYETEDGLTLVLNRTKDGEALRVQTSVHNKGEKEVTLEMLTSFGLRGVVADRVHRMQSFWSAEGKLRTESLEDLHIEPSWNRCGLRCEKFGNSGSMPVRKYFPFLALENSKTGEFVGIQLYLASTWQMELLCKEGDFLTVIGGLGDRDFGQWTKTLAPGESFDAPQAVIATGTSLLDVCDKLVKAQHPMISPVDQDMSILFNEYCTTWGNPSFENVKKIADKLEGKGIRFLVIDSGWYGNERWWECVGDWEVNENRFPGGMKPIADYVRSKGMIPGLWYEMEAVAYGSRFYNNAEHLVKKDGVPLTVGGRRFWDMEDPWVVEYLSRKVIGILKDAGFGYLKVDYNDTLGMGCDGAESLGEGLRRKVLAAQAFFAKIREEIPGIVIENCSSGGHRLEPSMMQLCSQASFSDAHEIKSIPLIAANVQRVIRPEQSQIWAMLRAGDSKERIEYSLIATLFGRMCLSGEIYDLSDKQWKIVEEGMEFYVKCAEIIKNGKTILHIYENTAYNKPKGQQFVVREWNGKRLAILHRFEDSHFASPEFPSGSRILAEYGSGDSDFSAKAWLYEIPG
ncbi:MAG: alpha-galactosidase [Lachnospiraceae bacterium]|nr:alpha-galactosidase [Lachnospiraceae bacterium]